VQNSVNALNIQKINFKPTDNCGGGGVSWFSYPEGVAALSVEKGAIGVAIV